MFNLRHPFFRPLAVRVLTTGVASGWALAELVMDNPGWALIFGAIGAWCAYEFFAVFDPDNYKDDDDA